MFNRRTLIANKMDVRFSSGGAGGASEGQFRDRTDSAARARRKRDKQSEQYLLL
jgi:hypothetical protein